MYRALEAVFRRLPLLLILLVLAPLLGVAFAYVLPHSYQSTASLWALHRYIAPGEVVSQTDLQSTPAQTQAAALSELLQTRSFVLPVAHETNLASTLNLSSSVLANPNQLDDALFSEISQHVQVTSPGYNLFEVSYTNPDPQVAKRVVAAVIAGYSSESAAISTAETKALLAYYQIQLAAAKNDVLTAIAAESHYAAAHTGLSGLQLDRDPHYALLVALALQAQTNVQNIQSEITTLNQAMSEQGTTPDTLFTLIDRPSLPDRPVSRLKSYLTDGGIGLGVALFACIVYIVMLVRRNRAVYTALDLEKVVYEPVVLQAPQLPAQTIALLLEESFLRSASEVGIFDRSGRNERK